MNLAYPRVSHLWRFTFQIPELHLGQNSYYLEIFKKIQMYTNTAMYLNCFSDTLTGLHDIQLYAKIQIFDSFWRQMW